jgi:hypothetical protein
MSRRSINFWKYIVFCGLPRLEAAWNDGIVESWNTEYKNMIPIFQHSNSPTTLKSNVLSPLSAALQSHLPALRPV